jgi:hypothetical protein
VYREKFRGSFSPGGKGKTEGGDHLGEVAGEAEESLRQDSRAEPGLRRVLFLGGRNGEALAQKIPFTKNHFVAFVFPSYYKTRPACI